MSLLYSFLIVILFFNYLSFSYSESQGLDSWSTKLEKFREKGVPADVVERLKAGLIEHKDELNKVDEEKKNLDNKVIDQQNEHQKEHENDEKESDFKKRILEKMRERNPSIDEQVVEKLLQDKKSDNRPDPLRKIQIAGHNHE